VPQTPLRAYSAPQTPAVFKGLTSRGEEIGGEGKGERKEAREGREGKGGRLP